MLIFAATFRKLIKIMANIYQKFKKDKLKEVILYILEKTGDISYYQLMKILFCSERVNLVACGDQITDLKFKARQHGPVPNELYSEITKAQDGNDSDLNGIVEIMDKYTLHALRKSNRDYLSVTDMESIDKGINELNGKTYEEVESYLHDDVYNRVMKSKRRVYSLIDIAESGNASDSMKNYILENQSISMSLM